MHFNSDSPLLSSDELRELSPSPFVRRHAAELVAAANGRQILDVAAGGGRNAVLIAHLGGEVICIDNDLRAFDTQRIRLRDTVFGPALSRIAPLKLDLLRDQWPFESASVGAIINVHFLATSLFQFFADSLTSGGALLVETVGGQGGNYKQLPRAGALRHVLQDNFALTVYRERKVGPTDYDAVAVKVFGTRGARY